MSMSLSKSSSNFIRMLKPFLKKIPLHGIYGYEDSLTWLMVKKIPLHGLYGYEDSLTWVIWLRRFPYMGYMVKKIPLHGLYG